MPLTLQTRLLRILQEKEVTPFGASQSSPVNFAVICATHRNLAQRVAEGTFREDLLYRLREFALTLPPLREWPELSGFIQRRGASWAEKASHRAGPGSCATPDVSSLAGQRPPAAKCVEGTAGPRRRGRKRWG